MLRGLFWFIAVCWAGCIPLTAQTVLTLEECRDMAIENNKALRIADESVREAHYNRREALANFFPQVSFSGGYVRNQHNIRLVNSDAIPNSITTPDLSSIIGIPGMEIDITELKNAILDKTTIDIKNVWTIGFSVTQPVYKGGQIIAYHDLRKYAEQLAESQRDTRLAEVITEADEAYWQVVSLVGKHALAQSFVDLMSRMESDIIALENEGMATRADRLSVSVKLNEAEMTLLRASNGVTLAKMLLCQICGLDISSDISLADENTVELIAPGYYEHADMDEALANRSELRSLDLAGRIYRQQERIAVADYLPTVALFASYLWTNPNAQNGFQKNFKGGYHVGVMVSVPLNFWSTTSKLNAARARTNSVRLQYEEAKEMIELDVRQQSFKLQEAEKKLAAASANSEKADENLRYANVGFQEGVISAADAMAAATAWISARSALTDAQIDVKLCRVYLDKALGRNIRNTK